MGKQLKMLIGFPNIQTWPFSERVKIKKSEIEGREEG